MQNFSPLLQFYANQIPDTHGRYIEDIWEFNHQKLEYTHNFIQWIFPFRGDVEIPSFTDFNKAG